MDKFRPFDYLTESEKMEVNRFEALSRATSNIHDFKELDKIIKEYLHLARIRKEIEVLESELKKWEEPENESIGISEEDEEDEEEAYKKDELLVSCP